jgi:bifunctional DNA-binding transcriptional regulator/antitoxin component of YhaV-PrlF toxin-antitoxin module
MVKHLVISSGGQISVPAAVRKRWGVRAVLVEDCGDRLVVRPAPADPVAAVRGIFAADMNDGPTIDEVRAAGRAEEAELDAQRASRR